MELNSRRILIMEKLRSKRIELEKIDLDFSPRGWSIFIFNNVINRSFGVKTRNLLEGVLWLFFDYDFKIIDPVFLGISKLAREKENKDFERFYETLKNESRILYHDIDDATYLREVEASDEVRNLKYGISRVMKNLRKRTSQSTIRKYLVLRTEGIMEDRAETGSRQRTA